MVKEKKIIIIAGPTASGKTDLALYLAQKFNGEIICADSRTIYKKMNIGTAKPSFEERLKIPHYLIDFLEPDQEFTVAEFKEKALVLIEQIFKKYKIPFLVGGTGLYLQAVVENLDIPPVPPDKKLRKQLEKEIQKKGLETLWKKLIKLDPQAADFVQKENPRRVIRALEVCLKTKKPFSLLRKKGTPLFNSLSIGPSFNKQELKKRIDQRVEKMISQGLVKEIQELIKQYPLSSPGFNSIGYQEIISYLQGEISLTEAITLIKKNTYQYARRQMTWFKKDKKINWVKNYTEAEKLIKDFLKDMAL
jgi:tRNA dimethylallyltransferase